MISLFWIFAGFVLGYVVGAARARFRRQREQGLMVQLSPLSGSRKKERAP